MLSTHIATVQQQIITLSQQYHRPARAVCLIAVSKTQSVNTIAQAYRLGLRAFGENYVQEALPKIDYLRPSCPELEWHLLGHVQSNKAKAVAKQFDWVQSIDQPKLVHKLNQYRPDSMAPLQLCLQINITNETQKSGLPLADLAGIDALAAEVQALPKVILRGLMAIGCADNKHVTNHGFEQLHQLYKQLSARYSTMDTLSLGMSNDMALAIAHGATMVRIGQAIFGPRVAK